MKKLSLVLVVLFFINIVAYGAGWTDAGSVVRLTTSSDKVGIGTSSPIEQLTTTSNAMIGNGTYPAIYLRDQYWWSGLLFRYDTPWDDNDSYVINIHQEGSANRPFVIQSKSTPGKGAGNPLLLIESYTGNVGIGTTSPAEKLDVTGTVQMNGFKLPVGATNGYVLTADGNGVGTWQPADSGGGTSWWAENNGDIYNNNDGNVGIGIASPKHKLEVEGTIETDYLYPSQGDGTPYRYLRFGDMSAFWAGFMWNYNSANYGDGDDFSIYTYDDRDITLYTGTGNIIMFPSSGGNVGIGTKSPADKLDVSGTVRMIGFRLPTDAQENYVLTSDASGNGTWQPADSGGGTSWWAENNGDIYNNNDGNVGIGTDAPLGNLHVSSGTSGDAVLYIEADTDNNNENDNPMIIFKQDGGIEESAIQQDNNALRIRNCVSSGGGITFETGTTNGYTNAVERVRIRYDGNVGIGTTSPADKLEVSGTVRMTGFRLPTDAQENYVLTSDASGNGSWQPVGGGGSSYWLPSGDDDIYYGVDGGEVGIGTDNPYSKLHVVGDIRVPYENKMVFGGAYIKGYLDSYGGLKFYGGGGGGAGNLAITVNPAGKVGIGTDQIQSELTVNGTITAEEIEVQLEILPDFVFEDDYELMSLNKLEKHIKKEKSLPGIPTSEEAVENGLKVGDMQAKLLQKVEELTLYVIEQDKKLNDLNNKVAELKEENKDLRQEISSLSN
jgi:hypothetical protein